MDVVLLKFEVSVLLQLMSSTWKPFLKMPVIYDGLSLVLMIAVSQTN
jgi:hypothetical protein